VVVDVDAVDVLLDGLALEEGFGFGLLLVGQAGALEQVGRGLGSLGFLAGLGCVVGLLVAFLCLFVETLPDVLDFLVNSANFLHLVDAEFAHLGSRLPHPLPALGPPLPQQLSQLSLQILAGRTLPI
jgi:hypothetical protein